MNIYKTTIMVGLCSLILAAVPGIGLNTPDHSEYDAIVNKGLKWLAEAQHENGAWGSGSHARQDVRDPGSVASDPATTAFAGLALVRAGSGLNDGPYRNEVRKAVQYLLGQINSSGQNSPQITEIRGTQPQTKLGENIDVAMTSQFLTRILSEAKGDPMEPAIRKALETCIRKLEMTQQGDGSWSGAGWAGVLQSAAAFNALEGARSQGIYTDDHKFQKAKDYQQGNVQVSGAIKTDAAAGIPLYSVAGNQRATARDAKKARTLVDEARKQGKIKKEAEITRETLEQLDIPDEEAAYLAEAFQKNQTTQRQLNDESMLAGFGNNGGEEFLSYMMTSESLIITGGPNWEQWNANIYQRLSKIQNNDGSWSGHHCITSPVFCTAAALLTLTTELDKELLISEKQ